MLLREQLKAIEQELGITKKGADVAIAEFRARLQRPGRLPQCRAVIVLKYPFPLPHSSSVRSVPHSHNLTSMSLRQRCYGTRAGGKGDR